MASYRLLLLAALAALFLGTCVQETRAWGSPAPPPAPSESECRPYIEKALKEMEHHEAAGSQEEGGASAETEEQAQGDAAATDGEDEGGKEDSEDVVSTTEGIDGASVEEADSQEAQDGSAEQEDKAEAESSKEETADSKEGTAEESAEGDEAATSGEAADGEASVEEGAESAEETEGGDSAEEGATAETASAEEAAEEASEAGESAEEAAEGGESAETTEGAESAEEAAEAEATSAEEPAEEVTEGAESAEEATEVEGAESAEETTEGAESAEEATEGAESAEEATEGAESAEEATEGAESAEEATETEGAESAEEATETEGAESAEEATETEGAESAEEATETEGAESAEEATEGAESAEEATEGAESAEEATEGGETSEEATEGAESAEEAAEGGESVEEATEAEEGEAASDDSKEDAAASAGGDSKEETSEPVEEEAQPVEGGSEETADKEAVEEPTVSAETADEQEAQAESGEESKEETEELPEEDLIMEIEIPENLRPRDHIGHILKLDEESAESETVLEKVTDATLRELKRLYDTAIKPLELLYKYRDLSNRHFGDPEIFSKPLILFMGPWSGGKSTIINYLLDNEYNQYSLRTGAEPSPAYFNILMHGERSEILDGTQLAADWTFSGLQKFGQGLLDRLRGVKLKSPLLEKVNIVEIPGILEIRKQVERMFPFNDACQWFIDRADIIFLVYDPSKLDVGPETEAILDQLKGREYQTRIILNKADQVKPEELMRVQGTLIWNISPLMSSAEPPIMYSTSLWSMPYENGAPIRLLQAQEHAFLRDLREAINKRVDNKIASARRFAVRVRNHAKMVDCYLTTYYNHKTFFGNKKKTADDIIEHPQDYHIYEGLSTLTNISRYDLPDPETYRDFFKLNPLYEFQQLAATCTYFRGCPINRLDVAIAYDLPELVGKYKMSVEDALEQHQKKEPKS
ncbi:Sarcalumenin [Frankliniella fusca]|uniref:Sarcalumenin n=1 Tax=Frankliniella fusca TaxID=407009 RepID=A0AAE1HJD8_9NEOP|nr:Sarcalumenin [Frankliniella fusca]